MPERFEKDLLPINKEEECTASVLFTENSGSMERVVWMSNDRDAENYVVIMLDQGNQVLYLPASHIFTIDK